MIESMACGTPVIATRWGAVPEVIEDGRSGIIVDDYREMAGVLARADELEPLECRRSVEERFSAERMVDDYVAAYETVLAERRGVPHGVVATCARTGFTLAARRRRLRSPRPAAARRSSRRRPGRLLAVSADDDVYAVGADGSGRRRWSPRRARSSTRTGLPTASGSPTGTRASGINVNDEI